MALVFKVGITTIYPIVNTTITERVGTFSDGTLPLEITNVKECFLPMSKLTIEDTQTNSKWVYVIVADDVEVITKTGTIYYRHNLTVRSGIYESTKHILRNTIFSQPKSREYVAKLNFCVCAKASVEDDTTVYIDDTTDFLLADYEEDKRQYSWEDIKLNRRVKIANVKCVCKTDTHCFSYCNDITSYSPNFSNVSEVVKDKWIRPKCFLNRYDNGVLVASEDATQAELADSMFQNITDKTVFKLEPEYGATYRFRDIPANTFGAVSVISFEFIFEVYYYSMYDIVKTLRDQSLKQYNYTSSLDLACLEMTDASKIAELQSIVAPEISFNGMTYYDALYQLLSYIDAIPTVDANGNLSYEYLNNNNAAHIEIDTKKADERISINDEYYTNKLVANYQNGRQDNAIIYPNPKRYLRTNTKSLGIPSSSGDYIFKLPKPIDYIDKVEINSVGLRVDLVFKVTIDERLITMSFFGINAEKIDMTSQVLEQEQYNLLNYYQDFYAEFQNQNNTICYSRGSDYIDLLNMASGQLNDKEIYSFAVKSAVNKYFGVAITSYQTSNFSLLIDDLGAASEKQNLYYRVTYHALFDGRVEQASTKEKYEGESFVAQDSAEVSLNRMGNNLQGLIAKVGNETENVTFDVTSYGSRVKLGSIWVDDDNEKYLANVVQTTFSTDLNRVIVNAQFTKNFNMISQFTKINQQKRFYEISDRLTTKGYENITEHMYLSYAPPYNSLYDSSAINEDLLFTLVAGTLRITDTIKSADYATFRPYTFLNDISYAINSEVMIPLHCYGSGNSICFEMDYDSSINAGNRLTGSGAPGSPYFTHTTLYTEEKGFADKVELNIYSSVQSGNYPNSFPYVSTTNDIKGVEIKEFRYFKKPNEIFHLNFALAFLSESGDEFFVGDKFINDNAVIPNAILSQSVRFSYGDNLYSIIDNKNINNSYASITMSAQIDTLDDKKYVKVTINLSTNVSCKSWALIDENNNILIASNKTMENVSQIIFYVIPRRNRI